MMPSTSTIPALAMLRTELLRCIVWEEEPLTPATTFVPLPSSLPELPRFSFAANCEDSSISIALEGDQSGVH